MAKERKLTAISGSPQRLYLFPLGYTTLPLPNGALEMVNGCYLVQTTDDKNILIDTGLPAEYEPPAGTPLPRNKTNVIQQLGTIGLKLENVDMLICTHFDVDHVGYNDTFSKAELVVQQEHYELARSGAPRYAAARSHWDNPLLRYRLIDG